MNRIRLFIRLIVLFTVLYFGYNIIKENSIYRPELLDKNIQKKSNSKGVASPLIRLENKIGTFCSGVVIDEHYALTAAHCFNNIQTKYFKFMVRSIGYAIQTEAKLAATVNYMDIAVIRGDFKLFKNFKTTSTMTGTKFRACGFPHGGINYFCTSLTNLTPQLFSIGARGFVYPGMSGGPVLNENNEVIGIISYSSRGHIGFYPIINILSYLGVR